MYNFQIFCTKDHLGRNFRWIGQLEQSYCKEMIVSTNRQLQIHNIARPKLFEVHVKNEHFQYIPFQIRQHGKIALNNN